MRTTTIHVHADGGGEDMRSLAIRPETEAAIEIEMRAADAPNVLNEMTKPMNSARKYDQPIPIKKMKMTRKAQDHDHAVAGVADVAEGEIVTRAETENRTSSQRTMPTPCTAAQLLVMITRMRWRPKNRDAEGVAHVLAIKKTIAVHVNPAAEDPQGIRVAMKIAGETTEMTETTTMCHAQDGDAVVAIARSPTGTIHAENAAMCRLGWKPSNYSSMPTSRTIRTPKAVAVVAEVADEGDNHLMWSAGGFR